MPTLTNQRWRLIQLGIVVALSFILAFLEKQININQSWITFGFIFLSLILGAVFENFIKRQLFKNSIISFISILRTVRIDFNLPATSIQEIMRQGTFNLLDSLGVRNGKATAEDIQRAGSKPCSTCDQLHLTDPDGKCTYCQVGVRFWQKMNEQGNE